MPFNVVLMTTFKCNSRCKTCYIWKNKGTAEAEFTLDEFKKLFDYMGEIYWVTAGGGEPFLRYDFQAILNALCRRVRPKIVNILSNGSMPDRILSTVNHLTRRYPKTHFIINLSLDHIGDKHDKIRGMDGNFNLLCKSIEGLKKMPASNLSLGINTVVSKYNIYDFPYIFKWVKDNFRPDFHIIENAQRREEYLNVNGEFMCGNNEYISVLNFYLAHMSKEHKRGMDKIKKALRIEYYRSSKKYLHGGIKPYRCYAGYASCQVFPDGSVWACGTRGLSMGNLRDYRYDFRRLWLSQKADEVRRKIKEDDCYCCLSNVSYENIILNPVRLLSVFLNFIRY